MAAPTMAQIRAGIAANLAAVYQAPSLSAIDQVQVSAYALDSPMPPTLQIKAPDDIEYNESMGRYPMSIHTLIVQGFAGSAFTIAAQTLLDQWITPSGVKAAIEADRTLGGIVNDTVVQRLRHYGPFKLPSGSTFHGAEWVVLVYVPGA